MPLRFTSDSERKELIAFGLLLIPNLLTLSLVDQSQKHHEAYRRIGKFVSLLATAEFLAAELIAHSEIQDIYGKANWYFDKRDPGAYPGFMRFTFLLAKYIVEDNWVQISN